MSDLFPWARTDDLLAGFHVPGDGRVNPVDLTQSLARGAKNLGVRVVEGVRVDDVLVEDGEVRGVRSSTGGDQIECEYVVNCTGMWARELGERSGVVIPNQAAEHYYLITDTIEGIDPNAPIFEDPASYGYYREEGGGMMVGLFEPHARRVVGRRHPPRRDFTTLKPDWDRMSPFLERAMARVPVTLEVGVRTFFCGPESFTPDLTPAVGEAPDLRNYFVAAGMNSVGVLSAGGLGRVLAHWIIDGLPDVDVTAWDVAPLPRRPARAGVPARAHHRDPRHRVRRTHAGQAAAHDARPAALPVHDRLVANGGLTARGLGLGGRRLVRRAGPSTPEAEADLGQGAVVRAVGGRAPHRPRGRRADGHVVHGEVLRHRLRGGRRARPPVGGRRERRARLDHLHAVAQRRRPDRGRPHRLEARRRRSSGWSPPTPRTATSRRCSAGAARGRDVIVEDATAAYAQLNLQGPLSRDVLAAARPTPTCRPRRGRSAASARSRSPASPVTCARITYLGELGYELYVAGRPRARAVRRAGSRRGRAAGRAQGAGEPADGEGLPRLRPRHRQHRLSVGCRARVRRRAGTPTSAARSALLARKARSRRPSGWCRSGSTDPEPLLYHAEPVLRDGEVVGYVRAASYGWTLGASVGLAFVSADEKVTKDWLDAGTWEVDIAGERYAAEVSLRPMYDPTSARVRA